MAIVAVAELQPGAVLGQPVYSPRGILLAAAGTVLTATHLATFNSWGVVEVTVVGDESSDQAAAPAMDEAQILAIQQLVEDRFSLVVPLNPFMREVRRVTEQLLMRRVAPDTPEDQ